MPRAGHHRGRRDDDAPETDPDWGEPGLSLAERLFGWNTLEVLAYKTGNPDNPVGAIPGRAAATCNLRFVVGTDWRAASDILRAHLDAHGFGQVQVKVRRGTATRLDPDDAWARWAAASLAATTGAAPAILPNLGGTVPNDAFSDVLGLPTIWVPHSYPCCQHGRTNICWPRSPVRPWPSWPACSGTWASRARPLWQNARRPRPADRRAGRFFPIQSPASSESSCHTRRRAQSASLPARLSDLSSERAGTWTPGCGTSIPACRASA